MANGATCRSSCWQLTRLTIQQFIMSHWSVLFFAWSVWHLWAVFGSIRAYTQVSLNVSVMRGKHADERITEDFCLERKVSACGDIKEWKVEKMAGVMTNAVFSDGLYVAPLMVLINSWTWYAVCGGSSMSLQCHFQVKEESLKRTGTAVSQMCALFTRQPEEQASWKPSEISQWQND